MKILRFAIGFIVVMGITASKHLFKAETTYYPVSFARYSLLGIRALAIYPWLGRKVQLFA